MKLFLRRLIFAGWSQPNGLTWLLLPLTGLYRVLSAIRKKLYDWDWLSRYQAPVPVVVVGNISVGGTGKTPLTLALTELLLERGLRPGIVSRGYGGKAMDWPQMVKPDSNPHYFGDEPVLIARRQRCPIVVGPERGKAIELLLSEHDCDVILTDDGLQHYALKRDIEISVVDAQRRQLNLFCLPSGPLREPPARLRSVDMVIFHVSKDAKVADELLAKLGLAQYWQQDSVKGSAKSLCQMHLVQQTVRSFAGQTITFDDLSQPVHAVAGIGHPQRFFNSLRAMGFNVLEHPFDDHHEFAASDFVFDDVFPIIMTEKDAVKCRAFAQEHFYYLPVEAQLNQQATKTIHRLLDAVL